MASLVIVDFAITGILIVISDRIDVLFFDLAVNVCVLGIVNLAGAWWLFRPIQAFLTTGADRDRAAARVDSLPFLSCTWAVLCTMIYCASASALGVFMPEDMDNLPLKPEIQAFSLMWFMFAYAVYYGFYIYFLVQDMSLDLKREMVSKGVTFRARDGRILHKLIAAFLVVAVMPSLLIGFDLSIFRPVRAAQGLTVEQTILLDLIASTFLVAVSLVFVTRSLLRPVDILTTTMDQLAKGNLGVSAPVLSGDEMGVMAERFNSMIEGLREREFIRETFGRFVPKNIVDTLLVHRGALEPQLKTATILFADIENFTQISEQNSPETVFKMLNAYFSAAVEPINRYGGVVNQFQGDAILVTFNVPVADERHADNAVAAAIELIETVSAGTFAGIRIGVRVGVHTGDVIGGAVGSEDRLSYTVHGDAVNLASRLEHLNKDLGTRLLVSESTTERLTKSYPLAPVGSFALRGKMETTTVYAYETRPR
ncbi:MAG: adenylate/guanylate cyclase domain-containing protein [Rhodospirillales bacterium]